MSRSKKHAKRLSVSNAESVEQPPPLSRGTLIAGGLVLFMLGAVAAFALSLQNNVRPRAIQLSEVAKAINDQQRTVWQLLDLPDEDLNEVDIIEMNLAVARGIKGLENLDVSTYQKAVDRWADQIRSSLPQAEEDFHKTPEQWKNDVRFFRLGVVASFLKHRIGIDYIEDQKHLKEVYYTDSSDLFIHGLIDSKEGTCGNMPVLQAAICRRLGWPVSIASVGSHAVCRFEDGDTAYNIEATASGTGGTFSAGDDDEYCRLKQISKHAITCGSDLHAMTGRQMLGYFIALRARHFTDTDKLELADRDYSLARSLFPEHRQTLLSAIGMTQWRGQSIFLHTEPGHPGYASWRRREREMMLAQQAEVDRINDINMRNAAQWNNPDWQQPNHHNLPSNDPFFNQRHGVNTN